MRFACIREARGDDFIINVYFSTKETQTMAINHTSVTAAEARKQNGGGRHHQEV
jgi:hypothetical protein